MVLNSDNDDEKDRIEYGLMHVIWMKSSVRNNEYIRRQTMQQCLFTLVNEKQNGIKATTSQIAFKKNFSTR